ncbi:hypothetical protein HID58_048105, partial [Brassica napus]
GRVPTKAKFQNFSIVLVSGNNNLCGGIKDLKLKPCFEIAPPMDTERPSLLKKVVIGNMEWEEYMVIGIALVFFFWKRSLEKDQPVNCLKETIHYTATPSQRCQTQVLDIVDKSMLHSCLRDGFPLVECLTLILEVGLRCCEGSPTSRLAMSQADKELISVRERFYKSRKCSREDTNGADNHVR